MRILVCDGLEKTGVDKLRSASGVTVDEQSTETVTLSGVVPITSRVAPGSTVSYTVTGTVHADSPAGVAGR